jgi:hypothetical protein
MKYIEIKVPILLRRDFKQWWFIKKIQLLTTCIRLINKFYIKYCIKQKDLFGKIKQISPEETKEIHSFLQVTIDLGYDISKEYHSIESE